MTPHGAGDEFARRSGRWLRTVSPDLVEPAGDGERVPGTYVTGWIKRGPIGLIGHTKSDAAETVAHLVAETGATATSRETSTVDAFLVERGVDVADLDHWLRLDHHEFDLGEPSGRVRVKVPGRDEMLAAGR